MGRRPDWDALLGAPGEPPRIDRGTQIADPESKGQQITAKRAHGKQAVHPASVEHRDRHGNLRPLNRGDAQ
ncbi:hypothetical protein [Tsukamurella soli]|uniref:Uncharacterized protein n=1 Tax=Tsukamurella soli TaxID=644556 RepID=A0ABP8J7G6_9ACTN